MKTPMVEKSAGLADSYAGGNLEEIWRARDRQVPMGFGGDAWDVAWAAVYLASDESRRKSTPGNGSIKGIPGGRPPLGKF